MANGSIAKWGFGMAPISQKMRNRYDRAVETALDILEGSAAADTVDLNDISELKGMFNRSIRQDQWDWFSVFSALGRPDRHLMRRYVGELTSLRRAIASKNQSEIERSSKLLIDWNVLQYLYVYKSGDVSNSSLGGWIYILSNREQPTVLKIGMTTRTVEERVKEINSATGLLIPYAARKVFRVADAPAAEKAIHSLLSNHRIRSDREFFEISFADAVRIIEEYIATESLESRHKGKIKNFNADRGFGFIRDESGNDLFFHISNVAGDCGDCLKAGAHCEFEPGRTQKGMCALKVSIIRPE